MLFGRSEAALRTGRENGSIPVAFEALGVWGSVLRATPKIARIYTHMDDAGIRVQLALHVSLYSTLRTTPLHGAATYREEIRHQPSDGVSAELSHLGAACSPPARFDLLGGPCDRRPPQGQERDLMSSISFGNGAASAGRQGTARVLFDSSSAVTVGLRALAKSESARPSEESPRPARGPPGIAMSAGLLVNGGTEENPAPARFGNDPRQYPIGAGSILGGHDLA